MGGAVVTLSFGSARAICTGVGVGVGVMRATCGRGVRVGVARGVGTGVGTGVGVTAGGVVLVAICALVFGL